MNRELPQNELTAIWREAGKLRLRVLRAKANFWLHVLNVNSATLYKNDAKRLFQTRLFITVTTINKYYIKIEFNYLSYYCI